MGEPFENNVLTNEERRYFGLDPILPKWERFEVKPGFIAYFDGDTIRKTVSFRTAPDAENENFLDYHETDNEIHTRGRQVVLPRTARGKEKKLNYTSISGMKPTGCSFWMNLAYQNWTSGLTAVNTRNSIYLPIEFPDDLDTLARFRQWMADFAAACPPDYFEKVERMKNTPHRTVKYFNGDIFRFEVDLEHYGFGLIIGQIRKMQKDGLLQDEHILRTTMGVPLLVRLYQLKTTDKNKPVEEITAYPLGKTFIMMDNQVIWGAYDLVGSKKLEASDIDFPIQAGPSTSGQDPDYVRICWGLGSIVRRHAKDFPGPLLERRLMRHGCNFGVSKLDYKHAMESSQEEAGLDELEQIAFRYFGIPFDTTFDEFNRQHNGKTSEEYAIYANQAGRNTKSKARERRRLFTIN